ncbi:MAG: hypothetical protein ORN49_02960 [Rhodobacteraceae bacterium]|nr:hypothetical protein [Paracoccaceae bacterium]
MSLVFSAIGDFQRRQSQLVGEPLHRFREVFEAIRWPGFRLRRQNLADHLELVGVAQAQRRAPSLHLDQIVTVRPSPDCRPASRLEQLAKAMRLDLVGWWWWLVPVLSIFVLPLVDELRPSRRLARVCVLAGVRATTTNLLTFYS